MSLEPMNESDQPLAAVISQKRELQPAVRGSEGEYLPKNIRFRQLRLPEPLRLESSNPVRHKRIWYRIRAHATEGSRRLVLRPSEVLRSSIQESGNRSLSLMILVLMRCQQSSTSARTSSGKRHSLSVSRPISSSTFPLYHSDCIPTLASES